MGAGFSQLHALISTLTLEPLLYSEKSLGVLRGVAGVSRSGCLAALNRQLLLKDTVSPSFLSSQLRWRLPIF